MPGAVTCARHYTTATLQTWSLPDDVIETAGLLVSELATNTVLHGQEPAPACPCPESGGAGRFWLRLHRNEARLLIEVQDMHTCPPVPQHAAVTAESGRGLLLVKELSHKWGYYYAGLYKIVWFEVWPAPPPIPLVSPDTRQGHSAARPARREHRGTSQAAAART